MSAIASIPAGSGFHSATRINRSLTAPAEKRVLEWMANRAPRWVTSDRLTLLGFTAQIGCGACFAFARFDRRFLLGAVVCLALNWLGDSLDGTLARVRRIERPRYGFYVDHMADIFGSVALMLGLGCSGLLHPAVAVAMLLAFLVLAAESYLATYTLSRFQLSQGLFGPTEIRIVLAIGTLALFRSPWATVFGRRFLLFDIGGTIAAAIMFAMAITVALRHTAQLYREEPLK
ncbi:MAG: CDP-alcohol phosphatidyltransferase family protein [Terracidiphilus sp.]